MTPEGTFAQSLRQAWELRFNQRIDDARTRLHALRDEAGLPPLLGPELPDSARPAETVELGLLTASLLRAEGQYDRSRELLDACERYVSGRGLSMPFQLPVQRALTLTLSGDWSRALELYLTALHRASNDWERFSALLNSLLCLENLGLPWERTRAELDGLERKHRADRAYHGAFSQLEVFDRRMAFRGGRVKPVFDALGKFDAEGVATEAGYYRLWVSRLPYHRYFENSSAAAEEEFIRSSPYFLKKSYRTRTLQGILHPDDLASVKISEFADRLYLWTWRWLADPASFPLERTMTLLRGFDPQEVARQTTVEDFQLIRNALTWISLFDPASDQLVQRVLQSMAPAQSRDYPLFGFERELLSYLRAERDRRKTEATDYLTGLKAHPIWKSTELKLARLADGRMPSESPLAALAARIARLRQPASPGKNRMIVELESGRVISARDGRAVISAPMAQAFELLHALESVDCARFAQVCFGLSRFDPLIHGSKIFNLLSRMRQMAPAELRFSVKSGRVWAKGTWTQVEIERGTGLSGTIQRHPEWSNLTARSISQPTFDPTERWVRPAQALKQLRGQAELTRKELEKLTGKSRSTANRIIERWLKQGILVRTGKARNTVYRFAKESEK